ncbi:type II DNA modification methyltransferase [Pilimelia terevasa]|uniref:site-specific DNA-methyltransferase (adenine-specific) n=1 Tax=Pilimelia terevasa TaxID=53372 RepID=A0A8J3BNK0_9ACTN|nr:N-6 DNA methylase [Pilimelia terevasa]GGK34501.1 type II DNA modification methyltransferase [Pilimelia terevasa]
MRRAAVTVEKAHGVHYTPPELGRFLAGRLLDHFPSTVRADLTVLDPACGDGELLLAVGRALHARGGRCRLTGYDRDPAAVALARRRLAGALPAVPRTLAAVDFVALSAERGAADPRFDVIVANPPYVRTQVLGAPRARLLADHFGLTGRIDLYQVFAAAFGRLLTDDGVLGLVTSNRFLSTRAGAGMRARLAREYAVRQVIDLGDTRLFRAAVLPALVFARRDPRGSPAVPLLTIYQDRAPGAATAVDSVYAALAAGASGRYAVDGRTYRVDRGTLPLAGHADRPWVSAEEHADFLAAVDRAAPLRFRDLGRIRVGVKTSADGVFIRADWADLPADQRPEPALRRPLISAPAAGRWRCAPGAATILYPYEMDRSRRTPVDLAGHPGAARYLAAHRARLAARRYVVESGRHWWEIWVPQRPAEWAQPKIVFPDISETARFAVDRSGAVVNGNCYWIPFGPAQEDLALLAVAVANSAVAHRYYDARFGNRLYAGRRRYITQYVSEFPLPDPGSPHARRAVALARALTEGAPRDPAAVEAAADEAVARAFGLG